MSSGPSSAGTSPPLRRTPPISCLHSLTCRADAAPTDGEDGPLLLDQDLPQAIRNLIVGFFKEAFDRLPHASETMPDLLRLLDAGGLCLGLLDPVSNIILNTLALLPYHAVATASSSPPAAKRSKTQAWADFPKPNNAEYVWQVMAGRSFISLVHFLVGYFGCLTEEQAIRYLYWARADLPLAVMLVQHDLYEHAQPQVLDPDSARTQAALKWAANKAYHPDPDTLVQLMAIRLYTDGFALLKKQFAGEDQRSISLTSENFRAIHRLLHRPYDAQMTHDDNIVERTTTSVDVSSDGSTITTTTTTVRRAAHRITSLRHIDDMAVKLTSCLTKASGQKHTLKTPCGDACDYLQSLKMYLHGMIHDFYITALTLLPTPSGSLMRSILMAGHCYGTMDPVSNIIVNSIWYNKRGCPLPESDRDRIEQYNDIRDPRSLLRTEVHSLKGLTKLAAFIDPQFSLAACDLENLRSAQCDIVNMLASPTERFEKNPFHEASMAAGHPLPIQLGKLHQQLLLMPSHRSKLLSLMTEARTNGTMLPIDDIASILDMVLSSSSRDPTPVLVQAPQLRVEALSVVSSARSNYEEGRSWFRSKLERLLKEYALQHVWEPKYTLDFICGVEESEQGPTPHDVHICYHVNFMATCGLRLQKTLFFAEFWCAEEPKPNFCCPLPYPYAVRCYYGVHKARKIVYPERAEYIDISEDRTCSSSVDSMLQMDLVYFSSERDVELAKNLNILPPSKKEYSDEELEE